MIGDDYIIFTFNYDYAGWAAIGFGSSMIRGVDMIRVYFSNNEPKADDLWSISHSIP